MQTWNFSIANKKEKTSNIVILFHKIKQSQSCFQQHTEQAFYQNIRKLLCILAASLIGTTIG